MKKKSVFQFRQIYENGPWDLAQGEKE